MIESFKNKVEKDLTLKIANYWTGTEFFKEVYNDVNKPNLNIEERLHKVSQHWMLAYRDLMSISNPKDNPVKFAIAYLILTTYKQAMKFLERRLDLKEEIDKQSSRDEELE